MPNFCHSLLHKIFLSIGRFCVLQVVSTEADQDQGQQPHMRVNIYTLCLYLFPNITRSLLYFWGGKTRSLKTVVKPLQLFRFHKNPIPVTLICYSKGLITA